jgi:cytidylate kinase
MRSRLIIAIDGPAGAGKSTVARRLARRLGYRFLDTGALYRAVTYAALRAGLDPAGEEQVAALAESADLRLVAGQDGLRVLLEGVDISTEIRGPDVTTAVSTVAAHPRVRAAMVPFQRAFAEPDGGVVAEGRDIGTVVFQDADLKFYLDADPTVRASRRAQESGEGDVARVHRQMAERDRDDAERKVSPLRVADDAVRIDSTELSLDQVIARILEVIEGESKDG